MKNLIIFSGPSCSGKSTVSKLVHAQMDHSYFACYDNLKWKLSGYNRDTDRKLIRSIFFGFIDVLTAEGLDIIASFSTRDAEKFTDFKKRVESFGYTIYFLHFTADPEVLRKRFAERLERFRVQGGNMAVRDEATFLANNASFYYPPESIVIDTTTASIDETLAQVMSVLQK
jgi:adenylylsulfate kinase-like enzyme